MQNTEKQQCTKTKSERITLVVGIVLCVVFGLLLLCNLTIIIKGAIDPKCPPSVLGITPLVVLSGSMSGTQEGHIEVGDLVFVGQIDPDELQVGDVIAYQNGQSTVTHRITDIQNENGKLLFTTKGDANNAADTAPVTEDQIVGVYRGRIPGMGDFALFLQQPLGMLLIVGVPVLAFVVYDIVRRQKLSARQKERTGELEAELARLRAQAGVHPTDESPEESETPESPGF